MSDEFDKEEAFIDLPNEEKTHKQEQSCDHAYQFSGVGQGKYDNYRCTKCGHEISKRWENEYGYR